VRRVRDFTGLSQRYLVSERSTINTEECLSVHSCGSVLRRNRSCPLTAYRPAMYGDGYLRWRCPRGQTGRRRRSAGYRLVKSSSWVARTIGRRRQPRGARPVRLSAPSQRRWRMAQIAIGRHTRCRISGPLQQPHWSVVIGNDDDVVPNKFYAVSEATYDNDLLIPTGP